MSYWDQTASATGDGALVALMHYTGPLPGATMDLTGPVVMFLAVLVVQGMLSMAAKQAGAISGVSPGMGVFQEVSGQVRGLVGQRAAIGMYGASSRMVSGAFGLVGPHAGSEVPGFCPLAVLGSWEGSTGPAGAHGCSGSLSRSRPGREIGKTKPTERRCRGSVSV